MKKLKAFYNANTKKINISALIIILCIGAVIFVCNDAFLYKKTVAQITDITESVTSQTNTQLGFKEDECKQVITAKILNGEHKGESVKIISNYSSSQVTDERYSSGDKVFISLKKDGKSKASIAGFKRDGYVAFSVALFFVAIVLVGNMKGFLSVVSVVFNIVVFLLGMDLYFKGVNLFLICAVACVLFSVVSLMLVSGANKKTLAAVLSALTGTAVTIIIAEIVLQVTGGSGVRFEQMEYLIRPYEVIFISELLVGGLGAIMDISITMSSSMSELIVKDKNITFSALNKSGREIGKDVMGTMTNVLFFTYVCGCVPLIVLALRNNVSFTDVMHNYISLEIVRSMVGSIGIVITIPIAIFISSRILKGGKK